MTTSIRAPSALIGVFWIEKYLTFSQSHEGKLIPTDHLFLAEYALRGDVTDAKLFEAAFFRTGTATPLERYGGDDKLWCNRYWVNRKVRSFDTLEALEQAHPPSESYYWEVSGNCVAGRIKPMRIGGPEKKTQIPNPHAMRLSQNGRPVRDLTAIDASAPLLIEWNRFENAKAGEVINDTIFVFIDDCLGQVVYFGGLPIDAEFIPFDSTSVTVPAQVLKPGEPYTVFFSQCRMMDQDGSDGLINCAVNSFGIELDIHTSGVKSGAPCPEPRLMAPYRWKRKTRASRGFETWPTIADT
jgi:hypothetical protein